MEELIRYIVENLVDNKESISISSVEESAKVTVVTILVDKDDIGKVIGKNGRTAMSIRNVMKSVGAKSHKKVFVKFED